MSVESSDLKKAERALSRVTNTRQARRILDARDDSALRLEIDDRTIYVTISEHGLYTVCYGSGNGLYNARTCNPGWVASCADRAHSIDVDHDPTPTAVTFPAPNRGDAS